MIDFHCHILPGLDDGLSTPEEALQVACWAEEAGVTNILATPHYADGYFTSKKEDVLRAVEEMNSLFAVNGLKIRLLPSTEGYLDMALLEAVKSGAITTVNMNGKYLLVEFPMHEIPAVAEDVLFQLAVAGVIPIIAHPERNADIVKDPNRLYSYVSRGVLAQLNLACILGKYGRRIKETAEILLKHELVHLIGTDIHKAEQAFAYKEAFDAIRKVIGEAGLVRLTQLNPAKVIAGEDVDVSGARPYKKKWFGWF